MNVWTSRLIILGAVFWFAGLGLVLAFGNDGVGDQNPAVFAGGLMLYSFFPVFLLAVGTELIARVRSRRRWGSNGPLGT